MLEDENDVFIDETSPQVQRLSKEQFMQLWESTPDTDPATVVTAIPYQHKGSKFNQDSIRITGSCNFINSILSKLKQMIALDNETNKTRVHALYQEIIDRDTGNTSGSWSCYIQIHARSNKKRGRPRKHKFGW